MNLDHEIYYLYLNELRSSRNTNMLKASRYLEAEFGLDTKKATELLAEWIALPMTYHEFLV
jgi:hypothetical protein